MKSVVVLAKDAIVKALLPEVMTKVALSDEARCLLEQLHELQQARVVGAPLQEQVAVIGHYAIRQWIEIGRCGALDDAGAYGFGEVLAEDWHASMRHDRDVIGLMPEIIEFR
ncbi:MAG: hypothetical protein WD359_00625 [Dehalococcoidia bacterium]